MNSNNFKAWMKQVDDELRKVCGLTHHDLADYKYADAFHDEVSPADVAEEVLIENDWPY